MVNACRFVCLMSFVFCGGLISAQKEDSLKTSKRVNADLKKLRQGERVDNHLVCADWLKSDFKAALQQFMRNYPYPGRYAAALEFVAYMQQLNPVWGPYEINIKVPVLAPSGCYICAIESRSLLEVYYRKLISVMHESDRTKALLAQVRQDYENKYGISSAVYIKECYCKAKIEARFDFDVAACADYFQTNSDDALNVKRVYGVDFSIESLRIVEDDMRRAIWELQRLSPARPNWFRRAAKAVAAKRAKDNESYYERVYRLIPGARIFPKK